MTTLPPHPSRWTEGTLSLHRQPDGSVAGVLTYAGGIVIHVRGWRRVEDGLVRFEAQHQADSEMEALFG